MRKFFIFISALTLAVTANATVINITPTSPYSAEHDNLRLALYYATAGDEIVLADGTYQEKDNYLYFDKDITVRAAEGAHPVIDMYTYAQIKTNANVRIEGLNFNGAAQGSYSYYIRFYDNSHTSLTLENCEFYDVKNYVLFGNNESHTDSLKVNNCYFHNNKKNAIYFEASGTSGVQTCDKLVFTNSTVAQSDSLENWTSTIDIRPYGTDNTDAIKVIIDHCTFYDNPTINTDHSSIRPYHLTDVTISNCIFVKGPNQKEKRNATSCYGGTISNCLVYDLDYSANGHRSGAVTNNTISDPLFNDLANNNYTYDANWSTGSISPALGSATDGSNLGDPRWNRDNEVLPSSSIASSYDLLSTKAQLTGDVKLNASNHIEYKGTSTPGTVKWKLHVERACMVSAVVDREAGNTSGCQLTLTAYDADGNEVGTLAATSGSYNDNDINLPGTITFTEAGDYTFVLTNSTNGSASVLEKIILSYLGGAVQDISTSANTTLNVADAWYSGCTRDNEKTYIQYPSSNTADAWIKWNIATTETKYYDVTLNINTEYAHGFAMYIYEDGASEPLEPTITEGTYVNTIGEMEIPLGRVNLIGDKNYVVKLINIPSGSQAKVTNVVFAPVVATSTALPNTLDFSNAVLSEKAHITNSMLYFNEIGDTNPQGQWAQWEVTTDHNGLFLFTMAVTSANEQSYKITILDNSENELDFYEASPGSGNQTLTHYFALASGTYFVKVENTRSYSQGHLVSLAVTEPNDVLTLDENATDNSSWLDKVVDKDADGPYYNVQIIRTIKAGMYNTFCLPFAVSSSQCKEIFGNDVQIRTLGSATVEEGDFILNLNFDAASDIYPGTPVLIQTSRDIVNPVFTGVKFTAATPSATTKTNANYTGTFVKTVLEANENILYLGANNKLFFPTASVEILGMRGWFVVHAAPGASSAPAIRSARIVENNQVATDIENTMVNGKCQNGKFIMDGQLIIIRDGIRYNVMGTKMK